MDDVSVTPTTSASGLAQLSAAYKDAINRLMPGVLALLPDSAPGRGTDIKCSTIEDFDFNVEQLGDSTWMFEHIAGLMAKRLVRRIAEAAWPGCEITIYPLSVDSVPGGSSTFRCHATALVAVGNTEVRFHA